MDKKRKKIIANIVIVAFIVCGIAWIASLFIHIGGEYTNNAQVRQNIVPVAARVQGFIKEIRFDEFQQVRKGDTLVLIEDSEYRLRVAQARADYQNALVGKTAMQTGISTTANNMAVTDAGMYEVEILMKNAETDYQRYKTLLENGAVTQQQFDGIKAKYESLKAKLETMKRQKQTTGLVKTEQTQRLEQNELRIDVAKAALELAELNLSYTVVLAPCDGVMSRKTIQVGELMMPGKPLFSVVDNSSKWVIANYRETQMADIAIDGKVEIVADAYPDVVFEGRVEAISNATGAQYSVASPDNSAGNFVKVEQRVPVKIVFAESNDAEALARLGAGMNVECKVMR
ncbi:MAG: HlyD family secretion protein [Prevotella sp.]|nr:HlyD family secretion protein [Prevotella sp.]MBR2034488.1 HlyD family secretion protein [Prevotella sp.]MBR6606123.1 HlyD family secretion protein [Prevotella sp.]MBR7125248.1 HlyD family secretion protein [Prevotella sp.]